MFTKFKKNKSQLLASSDNANKPRLSFLEKSYNNG